MINPNITFTDAACAFIKKKVLEKKNGVGFRLSIKTAGCSGYSYVTTIVDTINPSDTKFDIANGLTIFVDTVWLELLQGLQIDFVEDEKSGLKQKHLVFINPKESSRCGCGESFHVE